MPTGRRVVVALAGPNGAGKSTVGPVLLRDTLGIKEFVNADVIAQGLSAFDPEAAAITAGRVMIERLRHLADRRADFAFETTLAGRAYPVGFSMCGGTGTSSMSSTCGCATSSSPSNGCAGGWCSAAMTFRKP